MNTWLVLFIVFASAWVFGFAMIHVAGGLIHVLLLLAAISILLHFVAGKRAA
jgi:Family of unknown function (DUF5670)